MKSTTTALAVLALILLILLIRCCQERDELEAAVNASGTETTEPTAVGPHLVINHADAGDWINFSNKFSIDGCDPATTPTTYWPGILFQLGNYNFQSDFKFTEIHIYSGGSTTPDVYNDWVWINILSVASSRVSPPIDPDEAFGLYPNNGLPSTNGCSINPFSAGECERNRTISSNMEVVRSLITYWQGPAGYEVSANQASGDCTGNEYRFIFLDDFSVEVYEPSDPYEDTSMPSPTKTYGVGTVDKIEILVESNSPDLGQTQPPPWPYP